MSAALVEAAARFRRPHTGRTRGTVPRPCPAVARHSTRKIMRLESDILDCVDQLLDLVVPSPSESGQLATGRRTRAPAPRLRPPTHSRSGCHFPEANQHLSHRRNHSNSPTTDLRWTRLVVITGMPESRTIAALTAYGPGPSPVLFHGPFGQYGPAGLRTGGRGEGYFRPVKLPSVDAQVGSADLCTVVLMVQ